MTEQLQPVRVAVNVMRARLTVVGFNLAIITYQISVTPRFPGAIQLPNTAMPLHIVTDITLLIGLALSVIAMVCFITSTKLDNEGICTHWSLLSGDLFMYLALAYSVGGFFSPILQVLDQATLAIPQEAWELATVRMGVVISGGSAWFIATYVGPFVSLMRSPFSKRITIIQGGLYLLLVLSTAYINTQTIRLDALLGGNTVGTEPTILKELLQPLRW
ncbi:hypothetical protein [Methyloprofundus sp.]|uniref:hypothetical protein n=1 Tax=Methyloprofundus sp. TaxID=2020875 RepID=UPI003D109603